MAVVQGKDCRLIFSGDLRAVDQTLPVTDRDFRSWPKADMAVRDSDVRFRGQSGHPLREANVL